MKYKESGQRWRRWAPGAKERNMFILSWSRGEWAGRRPETGCTPAAGVAWTVMFGVKGKNSQMEGAKNRAEQAEAKTSQRRLSDNLRKLYTGVLRRLNTSGRTWVGRREYKTVMDEEVQQSLVCVHVFAGICHVCRANVTYYRSFPFSLNLSIFCEMEKRFQNHLNVQHVHKDGDILHEKSFWLSECVWTDAKQGFQPNKKNTLVWSMS